jgi:adenylate cyclase
MQKLLTDFNASLRERDLPACTMRAGISTGLMVVGDAGATAGLHRASDYTVIGDEVNLSARLESANKATGTQMLLNQRCAERCGDRFLLRPIGKLRVVGKTQGIMTYEALCQRAEITPELQRLADCSREVVDHFLAADLDACLAAASEMEARLGPNKLAHLYAAQCRTLRANPPAGEFDGLIVLGDK